MIGDLFSLDDDGIDDSPLSTRDWLLADEAAGRGTRRQYSTLPPPDARSDSGFVGLANQYVLEQRNAITICK
jgi:hypothetical protein